MARSLLWLPALGLILLSTPVFAQEEEQKQLEKLEQEIRDSHAREKELAAKAKAVVSEASEVTKHLISLAGEIQDREDSLLEITGRMQTLEGQIAAKKGDIFSQNKNLSSTLAALQRLSQRPPEYILMRPAQAVDTVRSATLLTSTMPEIERRTVELRRDLDALSALKGELGGEKARLQTELEGLKDQNKALEGLQRERRALYADYLAGAEQQRERAKRLGREVRDLKNLIERLEREMVTASRNVLPTPPLAKGASFRRARGYLPFPARGKVVRRFGDKTPAGAAKGINIQTVSGGQVIAPFDGRIIYASEFRDYGQLLIIAHSDGYHTLLAGLGRIDGLVGQWVLAGEPLGIMPNTRVASTESDSNAPGPALYLEIRQGGEPVDPLPWLRK